MPLLRSDRARPRHQAPFRPVRATAAMVAGLLLTFSGLTIPAAADPTGWSEGPCAATESTGVTVVVDFQNLDSPLGDPLVRCAHGLTATSTGLDALAAAGMSPQQAMRFRGFVCRIAGRPAADEVFTAGGGSHTEACVMPSPSYAYWSYWNATNGGGWALSQSGAASRTVTLGGLEGWSFSIDRSAGDNPAPRFDTTLPAASDGNDAASTTASTTTQTTAGDAPPSTADTSTAAPPSAESSTTATASTPASTSTSATTTTDGTGSALSTSESDPSSDSGPASSGSLGDASDDSAPAGGLADVLPPVAPTDDAHALAAARWLGQQLQSTPGGVFGATYGTDFYPDYGLTMDAVLALAAAGVGGDLIRTTAAKVFTSGDAYVSPDYPSAGALGKTALTLQAAGFDPTRFPAGTATRDLYAELRALLNADGSFGDSDSPFNHSLAVLALARTSDGVPQAAIDWLEHAQCAESTSTAYGAYGYQGCDGVDVDGTAITVQALVAVGVAASDPSIKNALTWIAGQQQTDGGMPAGFGGGSNSNGAGLAAQAFDAVGATSTVSARARTFVGGLQVQCTDSATAGSRFTGSDVGAIAYDANGFAQAITGQQDQWRRATAQAILAFGLPGLGRITANGAAAALPSDTCTTQPPTSRTSVTPRTVTGTSTAKVTTSTVVSGPGSGSTGTGSAGTGSAGTGSAGTGSTGTATDGAASSSSAASAGAADATNGTSSDPSRAAGPDDPGAPYPAQPAVDPAGLAATGVSSATVPLVGVGVLFVVGGALLLLVGRRRGTTGRHS